MSDRHTPDLIRAFDKARAASEERGFIYGTIGRANEDGSVSVVVAGRPRYLHVTVDGDQSSTIARNDNAPHRAGLPVRMKHLRGELTIVGVNELMLEAFLGGGGGGSQNVAFHHHNEESGLEYAINPTRLKQGRVRFVTALTVHVGPFHYFYNGSREYWPGGDIDLTSVQPTTAGMWAWVVVGVDPATNTAVAVAGAEQSTGTPLTVDQIADVVFASYIPCGAVRVRADDTSLGQISRYADARIWFGLTGLLALGHLGDVTLSAPTDGQVLAYDSGEWVNVTPGASDVAAAIWGAAAKATPVDADVVGLVDTEDANSLKKLSWASIKAALQAAFDSVYAAIGHDHDGVYSLVNHDHDGVYSLIGHNHDGVYSLVSHNHSHNSLTGLTTGDAHTQYALLPGRAGGQALHGGTGSGDDLTLESTSHATKGNVIAASPFLMQRSGAGATVVTNRVDGNAASLFSGPSNSRLLFTDDGTFRIAAYANASRAEILAGALNSGNITDLVEILANGQVVFGGITPATSAALEVRSTTGALLLPRLTTTQRNALTAANGMCIYNTTLGAVETYVGGAWRSAAHQNQTTVRVAGVAGTAVELLPAGTVVRQLGFVSWTINSSTNAPRGASLGAGLSSTLTPGGAEIDLYDVSTNVVKLRVNAGGSVDVRRTAGSLTYELVISMLWI